MKMFHFFNPKYLQVLLIFIGTTLPPIAIGNSYYDYDSYESRTPDFGEEGDENDDQDYVSIEQRCYEILLDNREALDLLFGSAEKAEQMVVNKVIGHHAINYWLLDEALHSIDQQLMKNGDNLDESTLLKIQEVELIIKEKISVLLGHYYPSNIKLYFNEMNSTTGIIDCAIGRHARNDHFNAVENSFIADFWSCEVPLWSLWMDLVAADYSNKSCTLEQSMEMLIKIEQASKKRASERFKFGEKLSKIKLELLVTLSTPKYRNFMMPILCDNSDSCQFYQEAICDPRLYNLVARMTKTLLSKTGEGFFATPDSMITMLEVTKRLNNVAKQLTTVASVRSSADDQEDAENMLVYYLGIVNLAFGRNSSGTWKQMTISNALHQFEQILIENDDYVGFAAEMILNQEKSNNEINETTVSVHMRRLQPSSDGMNRVEFNFGSVQIWTENLSDPSSLSTNTYALYYNSWGDVLRYINDSSDLSTSNNSSDDNRFFIGKGGVVSFTSKINATKKQIPVYYRINFDDLQIFRDDEGNAVSRCLSCGYYDIFSRTWSSKGCRVVAADDVGVTCHCNHTTNFAAFMSPYANEYEITETQNLWLNIFEYVGSITSVVGLTLSFIAFYIVRNAVRNDRLRVHMNLVAALLGVHLIQIGAEFAVSNNTVCVVTTVATHFFLLATFMWMLIEGVFLYFYVVQVFVRSKTENKKWMYIIGWIVPLIIVGVSAGYGLSNDIYVHPRFRLADQCEEGQLLHPEVKEELKYSICWLNSYSGMTWSFVGPAIAVIVLNLIILCKVIAALAKLAERKRASGIQRSDSSTNASKAKSKGTPQLLSFKTTSYEVRNDGRVNWFNNNNNNDGDSTKQSSPTHSYKHYPERYNSILTFQSNRGRFIKEAKRTVKGAAVLLPLLGISWIFGTVGYKSYALSLIFVILNSVQGVAIFLIYCVFNGEIYRALQRRITMFCMGRKQILRRRSVSSAGSVKSAFNKSVLKNLTRRSTLTPVYNRSNTPV